MTAGPTAGQRTALITGASRGLGLALARFLAMRDYRLVLTARDEAQLERAVGELGELAEIRWAAGDVRDARHRKELAGLAGDRLDLLINNASDLGATPLPPLAQYDLDRLRQVFEANLFAPIALVQDTLLVLHNARGWVINLSSDAARGGYPGWGAYGASKAALDLASLTLAGELEGVTVVSVDPGDMRTAMHQAAFPGEDISDRKLPADTLPFWGWLLEQEGREVNGRRFEAQADVWELA